MGYIFYNSNPYNVLSGDCVIRAISKLMNQSWEDTYVDICTQGLLMKEMPSTNHVWGSYLLTKGFRRTMMPDRCPDCYTVRDFSNDHPRGKYMLATGDHVVTVIDGNYYDTWDSGNEIPIYYWEKEQKHGY